MFIGFLLLSHFTTGRCSINPYVLRVLMMMRQQQPYGSTAMSMTPDPYGQLSTPDATPAIDDSLPDSLLTDDDRGMANRRGLGALGVALLAGAGKGDYAGSLAEGLAAYGSTRDSLLDKAEARALRLRQEERERENFERQDRFTSAQIANYEEDNRRAREKAEADRLALEEDVAKQRRVVEALAPEVRERLEPFVGTADFYKNYWEATKPREPEKPYRTQVGSSLIEIGPDGRPKVVYAAPPDPDAGGSSERPPTTRQFADGTTRQWNPDTESWDVIAKAGPTDEQLHDDIAAEANLRYRNWHSERMKGVGEMPSPAEVSAWLKKNPKGGLPPPKVPPSERKLRVKMRDGSERIMTEEQYMRWQFRLEAEAEVKRRSRKAQQLRGSLAPGVYDFDSEGNMLP